MEIIKYGRLSYGSNYSPDQLHRV